uniref:NADH dehydrogenase subunit 4L n=1 Tax=Tetramorium tsushimae TaxID=291737 RepID=A0A8F9RYY6_9HYME|nr:NADH dehydrogenase subunit 4L [Tetramorium tsushimae]
MFYDVLIYVQMFVVSFILMIYLYKYMLVLLMLMELMVMNISLIMFIIFGILKLEFYLVYYLVFSVCEGAMGLGLLVMIVRYYGNDLYYMFNMSKF